MANNGSNGRALYPTVGILGMLWALVASMRSKMPVLFEGSPGVGKSSVIRQFALWAGLESEMLIPSHHDPVDVAGFPVVQNGHVSREPMQSVRRACEKGTVLGIDEMWNCQASMQAVLQELMLDRKAGDLLLHADTMTVGATNSIEESTGGMERALALRGRVAMLCLRPTTDEVLAYFRRKPIAIPAAEIAPHDAVAYEDAVEVSMGNFAACAEFDERLVQVDPTEDALNNGAQYGSPRNWERGLRLWVASMLAGAPEDVSWKLLAGCVGDSCMVGFRAITDLRNGMPQPQDILSAPDKAMVPGDRTKQIGAMILLPRIAEQDVFAAWIYSARLQPEIGLALARALQTRPPKGSSPHAAAGQRVRVAQLAKLAAGRV